MMDVSQARQSGRRGELTNEEIATFMMDVPEAEHAARGLRRAGAEEIAEDRT
jgi:hypothetical protein